MNVLLVGTGTVGEAIAHLVKGRKWLGKMTLADYSLDRARTVADAVGAGYDVAQVDAGNAQQLKELIVGVGQAKVDHAACSDVDAAL